MRAIRIKENSLPFRILMYLWAAEDLAVKAFTPPHKWRAYEWNPSASMYYTAIYRLLKNGFIEIEEKDKERFVKITKAGELQVLLAKARMSDTQKWDGKWRLIVFDIPEKSKPDRNLFRKMLKQNAFVKLQASVYISPNPLNRSAIDYLKLTGLIKYIRILRVDDMDEDTDLKKKFGLT